jgi:hypothetical protein
MTFLWENQGSKEKQFFYMKTLYYNATIFRSYKTILRREKKTLHSR